MREWDAISVSPGAQTRPRTARANTIGPDTVCFDVDAEAQRIKCAGSATIITFAGH